MIAAQRLARQPRRTDRTETHLSASRCQNRYGILAAQRRRLDAQVGRPLELLLVYFSPSSVI
jgi:hypothetical protein